jgi:hypothetical protein
MLSLDVHTQEVMRKHLLPFINKKFSDWRSQEQFKVPFF